MTEFDEILKQLQVLEDRVAALAEAHSQGRRAADLFALVDRDVADLNTAFGAQRELLLAIRDEQAGQRRHLTEQGQALDGIVATLRMIHDTQLKHGRQLAEQGRALARRHPDG